MLQDNGVDDPWANSIKQDLKAGKRYLKTDRKTHTGSKERTKNHCTTSSHSDPNNSDYSSSCNHEHDLSCHECARLTCLVEQIDEKLNDKNVPLTEKQRDRSEYEYKQVQEMQIMIGVEHFYYNYLNTLAVTLLRIVNFEF